MLERLRVCHVLFIVNLMKLMKLMKLSIENVYQNNLNFEIPKSMGALKVSHFNPFMRSLKHGRFLASLASYSCSFAHGHTISQSR